MEDLEIRKARRIEQMVAKWLRRSRDNSARGRTSVSERPPEGIGQPPSRVKLMVDVPKDVLLGHYGFEVSPNLPLLVTSVVEGSTADGKLLPGDHILAINNEVVEDIPGEQAAALLRESQDTLQLTVLRCTSGGPKSSFLTAEKRARLKTNPVKVRFAEEVVVNGHTQGSSLLCMPNVLKVYLENGQTKAFKFEANTTVKDIILTLKEKLSIRSISYFALVLEEQYNVLKMYLLHEDELIERVAQRKDAHDYRCLFRVCFIPKDPLILLQQDPVAFEYLYLQSCSDVLQERFAVEMKCSVALRLAALHIQERIITCAQPQKVSLKYIEKDWGIENFISPTLLRNMRGKDIKKAISFHMKRNQLLLDPRQKHRLSAAQVRLSYLQILGDLKLYGGKIFNATLMLQDRESCITLLVGAKYGISQVVNNKLNIITMLAEFADISRLELTEESEKVSMVKIYLQDIKVLTLMLESNNAKDLACRISGYYRLFVDSGHSIFILGEKKAQMHRFSAEEGYESRTCSDSEDSSEQDSSLDRFSDTHSPKLSNSDPLTEEEREQELLGQERSATGGKKMSFCNGYDNTNDSLSETSDSANTESRGLKTSGSSDSMDALEEDDLETCSSSRPEFSYFYTPTLQELTSHAQAFSGPDGAEKPTATQEYFFSFLLPPHLSNSALAQPEGEFRREGETSASTLESKLAANNAMEYYSLCANISPASSGEKNTQSDSLEGSLLNGTGGGVERTCDGERRGFLLAPPPGFGDSSSDDEFYDAAERMTPTEMQAGAEGSCDGLGEQGLLRQSRRTKHRPEKAPWCANSLRKRRSFLQTHFTSQVSFPVAPPHTQENTDHACSDGEPVLSGTSGSPAVVCFRDLKTDSDLFEAQQLDQLAENKSASSDLMEREPDSLDMKAVTDPAVCPVSTTQAPQEGRECSDFACSSSTTETHDRSFVSSSNSDSLHTCLSTLEVSVQLEDPSAACREKAEEIARTAGGIQEHCRTSTEHDVNETSQTAKALPETGISYVLIEEIIHTTTKPSRSPSDKKLSYGPSSDHDLLSSEKVQKREHLVLNPGSSEPVARQVLGSLLPQENTNRMPSEASSENSENNQHLDVANATKLLSNSDDTSGVGMRLSWPASSSMVDHLGKCQQTDDNLEAIVSQSIPDVNPLSLKDGELHQMPHDLPAVPVRPSEGDGGQKVEEDIIRGEILDVNYILTSSLNVSEEESKDQRRAVRSDGLDYMSLDSLYKPTEPGEESRVSNLNGKKLCSDNATEDTNTPNVSSHAVVNVNETVALEHKTDRCSCRLTYTSCFSGPDNEAELDYVNPITYGASEGPLTTPPSTKGPVSLDLNPTGLTQECNSVVNGNSGDSNRWLPETHTKVLGHIKDRMCVSPFDFCHLLDNVVELQEILKQFWGSKVKHPRDECSAHFSENKNTLFEELQRLTSSCQKVIKTQRPSSETHNAVQESFQNLLQLTETCLQFTTCGLCSRRHKDLIVNLKDAICSYHQFVQAAKQACERNYPSLSVKLLVCQYTALTAALFCLVQQFRAPSCV
nr:FERM and PDZ domain-containing protein 1 isoform X3 [Pogona vitticeps]